MTVHSGNAGRLYSMAVQMENDFDRLMQINLLFFIQYFDTSICVLILGFFSAVIFTSLPQVPELESLYNNFMRQMSVLSGRYLVVLH